MAVKADNPIRLPSEDLLGRAPSARAFARQILELDTSEGVVVGVLGPWGSGKTSFINMARTDLSAGSFAIVEFNPWMFSGADQLVQSFFMELGAQIKLKSGLDGVGAALQDYGEMFSDLGWIPVVGTWIDRGRKLAKTVVEMRQRRREGVDRRRQELTEALRKLDKPIVVVVDDVDRLTTPEIRDIFKLIRLTAHFPNIIYVAAFDRHRVENALAEQGIPGRDYLEKILELGLDLPTVPDSVLDSQVFAALNDAMDGIEPAAPFNEGAWPDVYSEVIRPLIRNMRDVRRYAAAARGTLLELEGQIELVDVLVLEAIRVFRPDVFSLLGRAASGLTETTTIALTGSGSDPRLKSEIDMLLAGDDRTEGVATPLILRLFPAGSRHLPGGMHYGPEWKRSWLRERRVAHRDILALYFERVAGESLRAFVDAEGAWARLGDRQALDEYLRSLNPTRLEDVVASLEVFEDQFAESHVVPGVTVLLNLWPDLPDRSRGMFDFGSRVVVGRVTYRLLKALPSQEAVLAAVNQILPELSTLSAKLELVGDVGYREGRGHKLVAENLATQLELALRSEIRHADVDQLIAEPDLLRLLLLTANEATDGEDALVIDSDPRLTAAILTSARTESRSQSLGSRAVQRSHQLAWEALVTLYGDEETLRQRIDELKRSDINVDDGVLPLVDEYLDGRRPDQFGD